MTAYDIRADFARILKRHEDFDARFDADGKRRPEEQTATTAADAKTRSA